ncbi:hypothetical protein [Pseudomonas chlororaphis]|uniref:Two pore domain potassium channel family protein n=1 Tax=Pseudomonas chlororaphis TaxID=587753 RepID=A0A1Q8EVW5_9PSED|nr:hypothetical protein [Pseudomonas chlororaphis]OLF55948.1 hypothetical protein BTN82_04360 [Pseudomonas chlororaphis]
MYESRTQPLLSRLLFLRRLFLHVLATLALVGVSLLLGIAGHLYFEPGVGWDEALFNAAMVLGGIGPAAMPETAGGKLFFASYGLYTNLVFVAAFGLILTPVAHRLLHRFHFDPDERKG